MAKPHRRRTVRYPPHDKPEVAPAATVTVIPQIVKHSGWIHYNGTTFDFYPGDAPRVGKQFDVDPATEQRAYYQFVTSVIPASHTISKVEFWWNFRSKTSTPGDPDTLIHALYFGVSGWIGGVRVHSLVDPALEDQWIVLPDSVIPHIFLTGNTNVGIRDESPYTLPDPSWRIILENGEAVKEQAQLRITHAPA